MALDLNPDGYSNWLLDFDDTLITGWATWGISHAFPKLIQEHNLNNDPDLLGQAIITAQQEAQTNVDPHYLLSGLFRTMGWSQDLVAPMVEALQTQYTPSLFEDSIIFLDELKRRNCGIYAISNNPRAEKYSAALGIGQYFDLIITPKTAESCQPKPSSSMWNYLKSQVLEVSDTNTIMLGDDPWSDEDFARACNLPCLIVDRLARYKALGYGQSITSLHPALEFASRRSISQ